MYRAKAILSETIPNAKKAKRRGLSFRGEAETFRQRSLTSFEMTADFASLGSKIVLEASEKHDLTEASDASTT